jgi:hypothetical protein
MKFKKFYKISMDRQGNLHISNYESTIFLQSESDKELIFDILKKGEKESVMSGWDVAIPYSQPRASILEEVFENMKSNPGMNYSKANPNGGVCPVCHKGHLYKSGIFIECTSCGAVWNRKNGIIIKNPYQLIKGEKRESWQKPGVMEYRGDTRSVQGLELKSIADAHAVAKIADMDSYMIADVNDTFGHNSVFKTKDILDWEYEQSKGRDESKFKRIARLEVLSKQKRIVVFKQYPGKIVIFAQRDVADYREGYSSQIQMWSRLYLKLPKRNLIDISPDEFTIGERYSKTFSKKKMLDSLAGYFGGRSAERARPGRYQRFSREYTKDIPRVEAVYPPTLLQLVADYPEIVKQYNELNKITWSTSYNPTRRR